MGERGPQTPGREMVCPGAEGPSGIRNRSSEAIGTGEAELWFERCEIVRIQGVTGGQSHVQLTRRRGLGETRRGDATAYRWSHVTGRDDLAALTPRWFHEGLEELTSAWEPEHPRLAAQSAAVETLLLRAADLGWGRTEVSLRDVDQHVVQGRDGLRREDVRRHSMITMLMSVPDGAGTRTVRRETASCEPDRVTSAEALEGLVADLAAMRTGPEGEGVENVEAGEWPVILAPGHCGLFFHEICGHPLEGDILASGTSYLGPRIGRRVGPEWLTVHDDAALPRSFVRHELDDEGMPPATVRLIEAGVVTEPILDCASAAALGRRSNGRGRRVSYLHTAIPRQAHTAVACGTGDAASLAAGIRYGLLVQRMRLRHMSIGTGDFSFFVTEGRVVRHGEIGAPVRECAIRGSALATLERVEAVGADTSGFLGGGGCNKLDQGPLFVSFEQPSVRVAAMRVDPGLQ